jgi:large subunit ribosomal protein L24
MKIRKGDHVQVLRGKDRGREGVVLAAHPKDQTVVVEGVNVARKSKRSTNPNQPGGIIDKGMPLPVSAVALVVKGKPTRVGYEFDDKGNKIRIARRTGKAV